MLKLFLNLGVRVSYSMTVCLYPQSSPAILMVFSFVSVMCIYIYVFPMWSSCPRFIVLPGGWPITELGHRSVQSVIAIIASLGRSTWANSRQNSDQS